MVEFCYHTGHRNAQPTPENLHDLFMPLRPQILSFNRDELTKKWRRSFQVEKARSRPG